MGASATGNRALASTASGEVNGAAHKFTLPELPYRFDALAPHIDEQTMRTHHGKHHAGYVRKLNASLGDAGLTFSGSVEDLLQRLDHFGGNLEKSIRQNGGGHANHSLFWTLLSPSGGGEPFGKLGSAIRATYGSYSNFQEIFKSAATGVFGSGWAWLVRQPTGELKVIGLRNQLHPQMPYEGGPHGVPVLGLDVWEHAYYLKYQNRRGDYVDAFWNLVDWDRANQLYQNAGA